MDRFSDGETDLAVNRFLSQVRILLLEKSLHPVLPPATWLLFWYRYGFISKKHGSNLVAIW